MNIIDQTTTVANDLSEIICSLEVEISSIHTIPADMSQNKANSVAEVHAALRTAYGQQLRHLRSAREEVRQALDEMHQLTTVKPDLMVFVSPPPPDDDHQIQIPG